MKIYITLHYVTLRYVTSHHITLHYITLHYITIQYNTLHYITLHFITLHYFTLHYKKANNTYFLHRYCLKFLQLIVHDNKKMAISVFLTFSASEIVFYFRYRNQTIFRAYCKFFINVSKLWKISVLMGILPKSSIFLCMQLMFLNWSFIDNFNLSLFQVTTCT